MNVLLILPYDNTYRVGAAFIPSLSYQPLTLSTLAALIPEEAGAEITLVDEGVQRFDYNRRHYDVVGISIVTSSCKRGYLLADHFREKGSHVLLGGHHATLMPEEAALHADTVFIGSAEISFPQFFYDYIEGEPQKLYRQTCVSGDRIPVARRDLMTKKGYLKQPTIIADYGCGNSCRYCVIHSFWGKNAKRPISSVIEEMKGIGEKEYIFLDPSPISDREYAKELFTEMAKLHIVWAGLATLDITDDEELFELLVKSGCVGMLLGFESFNSADLSCMTKYKNKVSRYRSIVDRLHDHEIVVLGTFMVGMDGDTVDSIRAMPDLIEEAGIDIPRFAIATPFPNTPFHRSLEAENRILTRDWSRYDSVHCVYQPKNMSSGELEAEFVRLWKRTYSVKRILKRMKNTPQRKATALVTNLAFKIYANRIKRMIRGGT